MDGFELSVRQRWTEPDEVLLQQSQRNRHQNLRHTVSRQTTHSRGVVQHDRVTSVCVVVCVRNLLCAPARAAAGLHRHSFSRVIHVLHLHTHTHTHTHTTHTHTHHTHNTHLRVSACVTGVKNSTVCVCVCVCVSCTVCVCLCVFVTNEDIPLYNGTGMTGITR